MGTTIKTAAERGLPPGWVSAAEAAALMGVDAVTLEFMRVQRTAPTWALLDGKTPIYRREAVGEWVRARQ